MFPVRKRRLYTPITPPEDEENEDNKIYQAQRAVASKKKEIPENISTFTQNFNSNFAFKKCPKEMAENVEWKSIKPYFHKDPAPIESDVYSIRLNTVKVANSQLNVNIDDSELKRDESLNILEVIAQKIVKERNRIEASDKHIIHQKQQSIPVNCEHLKSIFLEHDESINVEAKAAATDSRDGFISSHLKASSESSGGEEVEESGDKPLMKKDNALDTDWIKEFMSSSMPPTRSRENPNERGIFPQTPSLSRSSKKISKKNRNTRFLED